MVPILMTERYNGLEVLRTIDKDGFFMHCGTVVSQKTPSSGVYFLYVNTCILPSKTQLMYINAMMNYQVHRGIDISSVR